MINLELNYLRYFYYLVICNGFTKAAEKLHVQQPVISRAIKLLELELGFKLVERQKKQIILTSEGKKIFKMAEEIFSKVKQITNFAEERLETPISDLNFATSDSFAFEVIGPSLKSFMKTYQKVRPIHHTGPADMFLEKISSGQIEFGIFFNVPKLPPDLVKTQIGKVDFNFIILKKLIKDHKILCSFIASQEQNEEIKLPLLERYRSRNKSVQIVAISTSSLARKSMALNGIGVTILPNFIIKQDLKNGVLAKLYEKAESLPVYIVERKSSYRSKAKNDLLNLIKKIIEI